MFIGFGFILVTRYCTAAIPVADTTTNSKAIDIKEGNDNNNLMLLPLLLYQ
jgi:hypothetical protein